MPPPPSPHPHLTRWQDIRSCAHTQHSLQHAYSNTGHLRQRLPLAIDAGPDTHNNLRTALSTIGVHPRLADLVCPSEESVHSAHAAPGAGDAPQGPLHTSPEAHTVPPPPSTIDTTPPAPQKSFVAQHLKMKSHNINKQKPEAFVHADLHEG